MYKKVQWPDLIDCNVHLNGSKKGIIYMLMTHKSKVLKGLSMYTVSTNSHA